MRDSQDDEVGYRRGVGVAGWGSGLQGICTLMPASKVVLLFCYMTRKPQLRKIRTMPASRHRESTGLWEWLPTPHSVADGKVCYWTNVETSPRPGAGMLPRNCGKEGRLLRTSRGCFKGSRHP